jgi:hypothetical protein
MKLIKQIDCDDNLYRKYLEQPLFTEKIDINKVIEKIYKFL